MRSEVRESVFKYIFARLFNPSDEGLFAVLCKNFKEDDQKFADELLKAVDLGQEKYLQAIEELSIGFKLERLYNADKCALIMGMAELDNFRQTPIPVVINETVNIVSKYSTESSTNFVNGILAEFVKEYLNG